MGQNRKILLGIIIVAIVGAASVAGLYLFSLGKTETVSLPAGCVKPSNGFLVIASDDATYGTGYNNSKGHGAPNNPWPLITVTQGTNVTITVCNIDVQAHSFNIIYYLPGAANTIAPGQVQTFSFMANVTGSFVIFCEVPCSIHPFMEDGLLEVTA
ncbi:MAG: hypothetical protein OK456_03080 [Thaumarchaeota archaeon]|nr:hypothetical protein [Nitrososphaerota archaeon]